MILSIYSFLLGLSLIFCRKLTNSGVIWSLSLFSSVFTLHTLIITAALYVVFFCTMGSALQIILGVELCFLIWILSVDYKNFQGTISKLLKSLRMAQYFDLTVRFIEIKNSDGILVQAKFYQHENLNAPIIFHINGGGFSHGELEQINPYNRFLNQQGYHVVVLPYRKIPHVDLETIIADLKAELEDALQYLKELGIHPESLNLSGRSAGGYLTFAVAEQFPIKTFKKIISYYPIVDFEVIHAKSHQGDLLNWPQRLNQLFPGQAGDPENLRKYSVKSFMNIACTQTLILHGNLDPVVDVEQALLLKERQNVEILILPNQSHGFDVSLYSLAAQATQKRIADFLKS